MNLEVDCPLSTSRYTKLPLSLWLSLQQISYKIAYFSKNYLLNQRCYDIDAHSQDCGIKKEG